MKPKHIAISPDSFLERLRKNSASPLHSCERYFSNVKRLLKLQIKLSIPIFTIFLLPEYEKPADDYIMFSDRMADFFHELPEMEIISQQKIKVSIFGKWYNLPGKAVESLKKSIELTRDYDNFFLNFCINYDGQEEIADACRLVSKHVQLGKITPDMVTKEAIKENIYSSYFLPPDLILVYGEKKMTGLLLWDSANSRVVFTGKSFMDFEEGNFETLME